MTLFHLPQWAEARPPWQRMGTAEATLRMDSMEVKDEWQDEDFPRYCVYMCVCVCAWESVFVCMQFAWFVHKPQQGWKIGHVCLMVKGSRCCSFLDVSVMCYVMKWCHVMNKTAGSTEWPAMEKLSATHTFAGKNNFYSRGNIFVKNEYNVYSQQCDTIYYIALPMLYMYLLQISKYS